MTSIRNSFAILILKLSLVKPLRKYFNKYVSKEKLNSYTLNPLIGESIEKGAIVRGKAYVVIF